MAEQLGQAVLTISADTRQLDAGLQRARQQADQAGQALEKAFSGASAGPAGATRSIEALQQRLQSLRASYETVQIGSKGFQQLQREIQRTEQELQQATRTSGEFGSSLLGALGVGAGLGAGAALGGFLKGSIQQTVQLETVTRKLSNTLGPEGAGRALAFTKGLSDQTGLSFKTLADGFGRFTAAATSANVPLETQRQLFAAVARSGQALGLSNDDINGSLLALQQIASTGVVQMDELRQQLGNRLPIALAASAKGLGVTQGELIKLVESGKLTASEFFPALTKGLNDLTAGAGGVETTAQIFGKLQNAWDQLQTSFGQNLLPSVAASVTLLTNAANSLSGVLGVLNKLPKGIGSFNSILSGSLLLGPAVGIEALKGLVPKPAQPTPFGPFRTKEQEAEAAARRQKQIEQEQKIAVQKQKQLDVDLRRDQATLQLADSEAQLQAAQLAPGLDDAQRTALQNRLSLNEKIRAVQVDQLALQRELDKPTGTGDGKPGAAGVATQNQRVIDDLRAKINAGQVQVATTRLQNQQADAAALRTQQERIRGQELEAANARAKLGATQQQTQLERQALAAGVEVSRTAQLRLQQEEQIASVVRQQQAAQKALQAERSKPKAQQDRVALDGLEDRLRKANADVRQAYADAGLALVQNARNAASELKSAQQSFNSIARGGFQYLTPIEQRRQLMQARASVQRGVDSGQIRPGIDTSTPEKLFAVANFAEQIVPAQERLTKAIDENRQATAALAGKDWQVYVSVPGQQTFVPLSNT